MTDQPQPGSPLSKGEPLDAEPDATGEAGTATDRGAAHVPGSPLYKGEPLDAERGPGLGCFWFQVVLLGIFLILTPLTVSWGFPTWISATLLILTLVLLLFAGQTVIFLLRLVAADRRTRRVPRSATARKTVGMLEEEESAKAAEPAEPSHQGEPAAPSHQGEAAAPSHQGEAAAPSVEGESPTP